jgi:hypothetical protein
MTSNQKLLTLFLGMVSAFLIVSQLVMGELLYRGVGGELRLWHRRTGHLTFTVVVIYIGLSIWFVINTPTRRKEGS